jgi:hypothetical protein
MWFGIFFHIGGVMASGTLFAWMLRFRVDWWSDRAV